MTQYKVIKKQNYSLSTMFGMLTCHIGDSAPAPRAIQYEPSIGKLLYLTIDTSARVFMDPGHTPLPPSICLFR